MRTTIDLPEPLLRSAKRRAEERKVTLSEIVGDALRAELSSKPAARRPFKLITTKGKPWPGIDLNKTSALIAIDDEARYKR
jgi:hypothetical protein